MHPTRVLRRDLVFRPFVQHVPLHVVEFAAHFRGVGVGCQLNTVAVGVEEINGLENGVIGDADDVNAVGLKLSLGFGEDFLAIHFESNVLHPFRCVRILAHIRAVREFEKGQNIATAGIQEDMHIGIRFFC